MGSVKRVRKHTPEHKRISKAFSESSERFIKLKDSYIFFGDDRTCYRATKADEQLTIYRQTGNKHIFRRSRNPDVPKTRDSTKMDALKHHVSFDLPLIAPDHDTKDIKSQHYMIPITPNNQKRRITQNAVMGGSAHEHINEQPSNAFITPDGRHEWLHLQAHSHGGKQAVENLVAGSRDSNSLQIGVEDALIFCRNTLNSVSSNLLMNATVKCATLPETNIGTICEYLITIQDTESAKNIACKPISINLQYHSSEQDNNLHYDHVRVVYKKTCEMILKKTNELLAIEDLLDDDAAINNSAEQRLSNDSQDQKMNDDE